MYSPIGVHCNQFFLLPSGDIKWLNESPLFSKRKIYRRILGGFPKVRGAPVTWVGLSGVFRLPALGESENQMDLNFDWVMVSSKNISVFRFGSCHHTWWVALFLGTGPKMIFVFIVSWANLATWPQEMQVFFKNSQKGFLERLMIEWIPSEFEHSKFESFAAIDHPARNNYKKKLGVEELFFSISNSLQNFLSSTSRQRRYKRIYIYICIYTICIHIYI